MNEPSTRLWQPDTHASGHRRASLREPHDRSDGASIDHACADDGFTLVELLVVIVVLGVLATIVVFAVRGVTDQGDENASASDAQILTKAQESYMAFEGEYGTETELVARGLLREESTLHDITLGGASGYTVVPAGGGSPTAPTTTTAALPVGPTYGGKPATMFGTGPRDILVLGTNGASASEAAQIAWSTVIGNVDAPTLDRLILLDAPVTLAEFETILTTAGPDLVMFVGSDQTADGHPYELGMAAKGITYSFIQNSMSVYTSLTIDFGPPFP